MRNKENGNCSAAEYQVRIVIYVMTSRFEGFALVLLEAKAFGLPIVSFDIRNGPNEIVSNGIYCFH